MIVTQEQIGRFIVLAHQQNMISQQILNQSIEDLIDIISSRIQHKTVEEVAITLFEKIFELRIDVLEWLAIENVTTTDYANRINDALSANIQLSAYSKLAQAISNVLDIQSQVFSPIVSKLQIENFNTILEKIQHEKPTYSMLEFLNLYPVPQIQAFKSWIDASLKMEFGLIVADLILTNQIQLSKKRIDAELIPFLEKSTLEYGAYAMFTEIWTPEITARTPFINKIEIYAAILELDNKTYYKTTKDDLFHLINN